MIEQYLSAFKKINAQLPHSSWLANKREQAINTFYELGFPSTHDEQWRYTKLTALEKDFFQPITNPVSTTIGLEQLKPWLLAETLTHRLIFIDGHYVPTLSQILPTLNQSTQLLNIKAVLQDPNIETLFNKTTHFQQQRFSAFNTAFVTDGAYITIPDNVIIAEPIELVFINNTANSAANIRNIISLGKNTKAMISERFINFYGQKNFTNKISEIFLAEGAQLAHYLIQSELKDNIHIGAINVRQQADSNFNSTAVTEGGQLVRNDMIVSLAQEKAVCTLKGLYLSSNRDHIDFHTHIDHCAPHGKSHAEYKGIITDRARGVFNGKIHVHPDAQKTDAQLSNQNLLLSRHAEIDTKPELEIYADDVKCSHGATVGQLDETSLFYLRSRGIDLNAAKNILTYAFAEEVIKDIPHIAMRQQLHTLLIKHLFNETMVTELL